MNKKEMIAEIKRLGGKANNGERKMDLQQRLDSLLLRLITKPKATKGPVPMAVMSDGAKLNKELLWGISVGIASLITLAVLVSYTLS